MFLLKQMGYVLISSILKKQFVKAYWKPVPVPKSVIEKLVTLLPLTVTADTVLMGSEWIAASACLVLLCKKFNVTHKVRQTSVGVKNKICKKYKGLRTKYLWKSQRIQENTSSNQETTPESGPLAFAGTKLST